MAYRDVFDELEPAERVALLDRATELTYSSSERIIGQDQSNPHIYVIRDGEVRVTRRGAGGEEVEVVRLGVGSIFGELAFVTRELASADVTAVDDVVVLRLSTAHIAQMSADDPHFGGRFYRSVAMVLAERLRDTTRRL